MGKKKTTICILLLAIGTIAFLPYLMFQKEKQEFTESNEMIAVFLGEEKSKTFPAKESGYVYNRTECTNDEEATWDESSWKLSITKITKETKCNVYFTAGFTEQEFAYTGAVEEFTVPVSGNYKLEVWGAQGGYDTAQNATLKGGLGGYSHGALSLEKGTKLFVYVGGQGKCSNGYSAATDVTFGGFNGGGYAGKTGSNTSNEQVSCGGGGATDIRIGEDTLYHRVIVAGGGGGIGIWGGSPGSYNYGGYGGGTEGETLGTIAGANQYQGAAFGMGANATTHVDLGGGGGGWYGGKVSTTTQDSGITGGAGGSGWIYTEAAFNTWQTGNTTDAANWKLDTKYYLTDAGTIAGNQSIPTHDGKNTMTGNSGNGYAKITLVR